MFLIRLSLVLVVLACITSTLSQPNDDRVKRYIDDDENYEFGVEPAQDLTDGGSVLLMIKNQFKDIILDLGFQVFKYVVKCLNHFKVRLLRKLATYTLSDVFHVLFDGVSELVVESPVPVADVYESVTEPIRAVVRPTPDYDLNAHLLSQIFGVRK